ncbi:hypothetical protein ACFWBT_29650, partial [Streptomyces sp. NPDC060027]
MSIVVTAGQRGDSPQFEPVLEKVRVPRIGPGRPRVRPIACALTRHPMQLSGQAAVASGDGFGGANAIASSNLW